MEYYESDLNQEFLAPLKNYEDIGVEKLWVRGNLPKRSLKQKVVSIVGSRHSTKYGDNIAYRAAYELARRGVIIVSGMAYGIDAATHRGCL